MQRKNARTYAVRLLGVVFLAMVVQGLAGCSGGAEAQKPIAAPDPKAPPGGGSVDDYRQHMQDTARKSGR